MVPTLWVDSSVSVPVASVKGMGGGCGFMNFSLPQYSCMHKGGVRISVAQAPSTAGGGEGRGLAGYEMEASDGEEVEV